MRIIGGELKGRTLRTMTGPGYRPAMSKVRQAIFSMLEARMGTVAGAAVLDLFAGSASLAFEALSRGAAFAVCVENNPKAAELIRRNAVTLGLPPERCRVICEDAGRFARKPGGREFDLVFIDPPYQLDVVSAVVTHLARQGWLAERAFVVAEVERRARVATDLSSLFLELDADRVYGQTRILLWKHTLE